MSKNKRKAKTPKEQKQPTNTPVNIVLPDSLKAKEMQKIITNALLAVEDAKEQKAKKQKEQERKEWEETVGHNPIKRIFKILFLSKSKIKGDKTTFALLKMFIEMFFGLRRF